MNSYLITSFQLHETPSNQHFLTIVLLALISQDLSFQLKISSKKKSNEGHSKVSLFSAYDCAVGEGCMFVKMFEGICEQGNYWVGDPLPILLKDGGCGSSLIIIEDGVEAGEVDQTIFCVILKLYYNRLCNIFLMFFKQF